tara:strand:- start:986 stop:1240 length:255 start_codon:yes stop_codon:yes gene_type:complete
MAKKIKKKELDTLQAVISELNNIKLRIGDVETQKHLLLHKAAELEGTDLKKVQDELEETYGKVSINITDGTISEIDKDESSKKD